MALILKENQSFENILTGGIYPEAYLKIGNVSQYNHTEKILSFYLLYYYDQQSRINNKEPIFTEQFTVPTIDFDNWFSPQIQDGTNLVRQAYLYLLQMPLLEFNEEAQSMQQVGLKWGDQWVADV